MDLRKFVSTALDMASKSKDPSTKVGCVIVDDDGTILATGWNGFPRGVLDDSERYNDREIKYKLIAHAEQNAIAQAARVGAKLLGSTLIVTALYPCSSCAKSIIQAGVKRILAPRQVDNPRWEDEQVFSELMFSEAGIEVEYY